MKCSSCQVEVPKTYEAALKVNRCPACGGRIVESNSMGCFVPLCAILDDILKDTSIDVEQLASTIITTFDVVEKGTAAKPHLVRKAGEVNDFDLDQPTDTAHQTLEQMREQAYRESLGAQWGMDVKADASIRVPGEPAPVSMNGMDPGEQLIDKKRMMTQAKMESGLCVVKRSG